MNEQQTMQKKEKQVLYHLKRFFHRLIDSSRPRPVPISHDNISQMVKPILQDVVCAVIPVKIVAKEHELVSSLAIPSGDVVGEGLADDVVCS